MARVYDIVSRLENANQKPEIKIDDEHIYKVNNSKAVAFKIMALSEDERVKETEMFDKIITLALGEKACEYIDSLDLSMTAYTTIINAIMAAIGDVEIEDIEEQAKKKEKPRK